MGSVHAGCRARCQVLVACVAVCLGAAACEVSHDSRTPDCVRDAKPHALPLPSQVGREAYLAALEAFVQSFEYRELGWCEDKGNVRDTGPYVNGTGYLGTHPPVHLAYSPEAIDWLESGREADELPDGTLLVKEQWYSVEVNGQQRSMMPAVAYADLTRDALDDLFDAGQAGWTTMLKDSSASHAGWFFAEIYKGATPNDPDGFGPLTDNVGSPCERCHASAEVESTFIDTANIAGFPGEPEHYEIEDGWMTQSSNTPDPDAYRQTPAYKAYPRAFVPWLPNTQSISPADPDPLWRALYPSVGDVPEGEVERFPAASLDHVPHPPYEQVFVTADQCLGCHGALQGMGDPMFERNATPGAMGTDISPFGDWRFTPMGLAGRDPVFYAQLETEVAMVRADGESDETIAAFRQGAVETCMGCHGGPGVRQAQLDGVPFKTDFLAISDPEDDNYAYGALARDGINCTLCHHIDDQGSETEFFAKFTTGRLPMSEPNTLYGPFQDDTLQPKPMEHGVGFTPRYAAHLADSSRASRLCGHCHTINLPVIDAVPGVAPDRAFPIGFGDPTYPFPIHAEQATYTEWLNSDFQTIFGEPKSAARSCQDCHMQKAFEGNAIETIIAAVQDESYPEVPYLLPDLELKARTEYGRHQFVGLNVPLLQMFNQFYNVLGVNKSNYMSGLDTALGDTVAAMLAQAERDTVTLEVNAHVADEDIVADVTLTNLTGHRFPSGVAFRRAFLQVLLVDADSGTVLWGSGRTNPIGVIVDGAGAPLPSEFFEDDRWQPHYAEISGEDQVQIYEEVALDNAGHVTYSFLRRDEDPKDNRLLPKGWRAEGPSDTLPEEVIASTHPRGRAKDDPRYQDGSGTDAVTYRIPRPQDVDPSRLRVQVSLAYQATSPAFLQEKFKWSPQGPATRRLYYLLSHLQTEGSAIEGWKLTLQSKTVTPEP